MEGQELSYFTAEDVAEGAGAGVDVRAVGVASHYFVTLMQPSEGRGYGASFFSRNLTLKTVNEELDRVQTSLIQSLNDRLSVVELLQDRFKQRDEVVLEKVIYRVKAKRSVDF